ncbi:MAG: response regulator transcription factor [Armatimonadetes bacterium]|nr:response regulator transcription factor [Armatimonadota bacterium]
MEQILSAATSLSVTVAALYAPNQRSIQSMGTQVLSPREEQLVQLAIEGHTNDSIAKKLGLSPSTINTYWVRIRTKVQGDNRTAVIARIIGERAAQAERDCLLDLHVGRAQIQLAMDQFRCVAWATDLDLRITHASGCDSPDFPEDMRCEVGRTIFDAFRTDAKNHPAVAADLSALAGVPAEARVAGDVVQFSVRPLKDDDGAITGCIGMMTLPRGSV